MTATELNNYIGTSAYIESSDMFFPITIVDARISWGTVQVLVRPTNGIGSAWKALASLKDDDGVGVG